MPLPPSCSMTCNPHSFFIVPAQRPARLTASQRVSADVMRWQLDAIVREEPFLDYNFPLDQFGGVNASGGGWAKEGAADAIAMCIFPDLSTIDSWGLTYHSDGTIRGADLTNLLRYKPPQAPHVFS